MLLNRYVLVLNRNYEPLSVCSVRRAILLIFRGKAHIVEELDSKIRTVREHFPVPSVVRLEIYVRIPYKNIVLTKRNIVKRDRHQCQYCGTTQGPMTVDHVIPRTQGGRNRWENLVCACMRCNAKKGRQSPEQAGLSLIREPSSPHFLMFIKNVVEVPDRRWRPYLFMD